MQLNGYSTSQEYDFEFLPEDLGYFQKRSFIKEKISEKNDNTLVFIQGNKILSVVVESDSVGWLPYSKGLWFYDIFEVQDDQKYVIISENDEYFYGYIDKFPCVFKFDITEVESILNEYSDGEKIHFYGIGNVIGNHYIQVKSFSQICNLLNIQKINDKHDYVMEDSSAYATSLNALSEYSILFFQWNEIYQNQLKKSQKRSLIFFLVGLFLFSFSYFLKTY